jgi:uncharacterized repeat protein (TIGR01451 family)
MKRALAILVLALALPATAHAGFTPAPGSPLPVGNVPWPVEIGDLNHDGVADLVATNFGDNTVSVKLGDGGATYHEAGGSPIPLSCSPNAVNLGDLDRDGIPDLATGDICNYPGGIDQITVLLGNGDGTFHAAPFPPLKLGAGVYAPCTIQLVDLNGDGRLDLVTADWQTDDVSVFLQNSSGPFGFTQAPGSPFFPGTSPFEVTVGDFDGDGIPDLATANDGDDAVAVFHGNGDGTFAPMSGSPIAVGSHPEGVRVGDVDGDGRLDLAVANYGSSDVSLLLGNGNGTFHAAGPPTAVSGSNPYMVAIADLNGDGRPDLATSNYASNDVSVLFGNGDGTFAEASASPFGVGSGPYWVDVGDLDEDGRPDLVTSNFNSANLTILLNTYVFPPWAPRNVSATAGDGQATITWSPPIHDGGAPITAYTVTAGPVGQTCTWSGGPLTCTITGLTNGVHYTFTVTARNAAGAGSSSSTSNAVTPAATTPAGDTPPAGAPPAGKAPARTRKPRLALSVTASRARLRADQSATLTIHVRNPSGRAVARVRVCNRLPSGLVYVSSSPPARLTKDGYCWTLERLGARASRTVRVGVRALAGANGRKLNRASATAAGARAATAAAAIRVLPARAVGGGVTG